MFDDAAAKAVMSSERAHNVDLMVDLEHLSLDTESRSYDPDARAWLRLEVRPGPELWAVNVRWTDDGARRLLAKTQRYISPAFITDDENRVIEIVNIALTAMPATYGTPALVAANRRPRMTLKQRIAILSARKSLLDDKLAKLADDGEGAPAGKFAAVRAAADKASQALADLEGASSDVDASFAAMDAAIAAVKEFEDAVSAMTGGSAPSPEPAPEASNAAPEQMARRDAELVALRKELERRKAEDAKREHEAKVAKLAAEMVERRGLVAELVKLGRETPATAWADDTATAPRGFLASMPIAELRARVDDFRKLGGFDVGPRRPNGLGAEMVDSNRPGEDEVTYVKARHAQLASEGMKLRTVEETLSRYARIKDQQMAGAKEKGDDSLVAALAKPVRRGVLVQASRAGIIMLASTPVQPIEEFGASSQIAMQSFRLEYNVALASMPASWAETIGKMLPDGSLKTTFPLSFNALQFREKTAQNAAAGAPLSADIEVKQREFYEGQQVELRRLKMGDFAYVQRWAQMAADLARARVFLRNELVTTILEAGTLGYWGYSSTATTGIDGQPYFSASHKVNPFDASKKLRGSATFSNYQASATPLGASNLTTEKNTALQVAAPDGRELGVTYDGILYPSSLEQTAYNLLKVQDLILDAATTKNGVSNVMAATRNPHFNSGLEMTRAQDLAGTDTTANYYLYAREAIARGLVPWVIAEDPTEEIRQFDESSDFYKTTGFIKYESHVFLNAALLYPHAIRLVKGA